MTRMHTYPHTDTVRVHAQYVRVIRRSGKYRNLSGSPSPPPEASIILTLFTNRNENVLYARLLSMPGRRR